MGPAPEDCERKQSDYLRSRKAQLLDEVRTRFGDLLSIVTGTAPRLLPSRPDNSSPRIPILRQVGAPGFADTNCRQPEPVCGLPRISPAAAHPHPNNAKSN